MNEKESPKQKYSTSEEDGFLKEIKSYLIYILLTSAAAFSLFLYTQNWLLLILSLLTVIGFLGTREAASVQLKENADRRKIGEIVSEPEQKTTARLVAVATGSAKVFGLINLIIISVSGYQVFFS